jgi:PAS domain-containing protein
MDGSLYTIFENRYIHKEGHAVWLSWTTTQRTQEDLFYSVAIDITERKRAEMDLKNAYSRLQTTQKIANIGYWSMDLKTGSINWSDEVYEIYVDPETFDLIRRIFIDLYHPDDRHLLREIQLKNLHRMIFVRSNTASSRPMER